MSSKTLSRKQKSNTIQKTSKTTFYKPFVKSSPQVVKKFHHRPSKYVPVERKRPSVGKARVHCSIIAATFFVTLNGKLFPINQLFFPNILQLHNPILNLPL